MTTQTKDHKDQQEPAFLKNLSAANKGIIKASKEVAVAETAPAPPKNVFQAISCIQHELSKIGIAKGQKNANQGYMFRGIDDIYSALAPLLAKYKLCILPHVQKRDFIEHTTGKGTTLFRAILDIRYDFFLADAPESTFHTVVAGEAMDSGDKAVNKAMSAAYKYNIIQTFCIPVEGDEDADATTHDEVRSTSKPAKQPEKNPLELDIPLTEQGAIDYHLFAIALDSHVKAAKVSGDLAAYKKANAKTLNAMKIDAPHLFETIKTSFASKEADLMGIERVA